MNLKILFEDDNLLVIDKPAGLVVNRAETTKEETIQDWIEGRHSGEPKATPESLAKEMLDPASMTIEEEFKNRSGIVHRLDKDTSGLLVIAKTPESFLNLKKQFKSREVIKKYLALAHGKLYPKMGSIDAPIDRNPFNRMHFGIFPGGREAKTDYEMLKQVQHDTEILSLVKLTPHTGRTHQIRVHLKYLNHPIVSDPIYGGRKQYKKDLGFCPRLFLHATYLKISNMEFASPLPPDLQSVLDHLQ